MVTKQSIGSFILGLLLLVPLQAETGLDIKLRVYEGTQMGSVDTPALVTSSYIQPTISANLRIGMELEREKSQIQKVFNLSDVKVLTEADLHFAEVKDESVRHHFRLNSHAYEVYLLLKEWRAGGRFVVLVNEEALEETDKKTNILTTEMILHGGHSAVFGFEDRRGKPYFVSFLVTGPEDKIVPPPPPPPPRPAPPAPPVDPEQIKEFEEGAVKAQNELDPPTLINKVDPKYPDDARRSGKEDNVILNVRTDTRGNVERVMVLKGKFPSLNNAAVEALRQWKYRPYVIDGRARSVVFTVNVRFKLKESSGDSLEVGGDIPQPAVLKRVDPIYPEDARKAGVEGTVILYVTTDTEGRVDRVRVLKSIPALDRAAMDAVGQWEYEPYIHEGKPTPVSFSVTVNFKLQ